MYIKSHLPRSSHESPPHPRGSLSPYTPPDTVTTRTWISRPSPPNHPLQAQLAPSRSDPGTDYLIIYPGSIFSMITSLHPSHPWPSQASIKGPDPTTKESSHFHFPTLQTHSRTPEALRTHPPTLSGPFMERRGLIPTETSITHYHH